jgi:hypothetical protein
MKRILLLGIAAASPLGAQPSVPRWTLSARPTLDIGSESNTQTQFNGVTGIVRMPGGEIVVANGTSQELRVFSAIGNYLRTLSVNGRTVYLRALDRIWRGKGDTIYAAEILQNESNLLTFTLDGFVSRRQVGASNAGGIYPIDRFPDGQLVVGAAARRRSPNRPSALFMDSTPVGIMGDSRMPRWITQAKTQMFLDVSYGRGPGRASLNPAPYPYGRAAKYAVSGSRLWIGDTETGTITQYSSAGRGLMVFPAPTAQRLLDTVAIRRYRLSDLDWQESMRRSNLLSLPLPEKAPRFAGFVAGANGEMWIELFREDPTAPRSYVIVNEMGRPIGRATMPARMIPLEIGSADVMGVRTDEEGLEHVVRYSLRRSPP